MVGAAGGMVHAMYMQTKSVSSLTAHVRAGGGGLPPAGLPARRSCSPALLLLAWLALAPHLDPGVAQPAWPPKVRAIEQRLQLPRRRWLLSCGRRAGGARVLHHLAPG